jgi:hypothetical protein
MISCTCGKESGRRDAGTGGTTRGGGISRDLLNADPRSQRTSPPISNEPYLQSLLGVWRHRIPALPTKAGTSLSAAPGRRRNQD